MAWEPIGIPHMLIQPFYENAIKLVPPKPSLEVGLTNLKVKKVPCVQRNADEVLERSP